MKIKILATNRRARFDYDLGEKYEAGLVLSGQEVKSIKTGHISLKGSFVTLKNNELFLTNAIIPSYKFAGKIQNYDPTQPRKLLLKKSEIKSLIGKMHAEGVSLIPTKIYTRKKFIKLAFAVGKGKKQHDKRETIKRRDSKRRIARIIRNS